MLGKVANQLLGPQSRTRSNRYRKTSCWANCDWLLDTLIFHGFHFDGGMKERDRERYRETHYHRENKWTTSAAPPVCS